MVIFYFGADKPAAELRTYGYKRRNTILLKTLGENPAVQKVLTFNYTTRKVFLKHFFENFRKESGKIKDVYFTELFAFGRFRFHFLNRLFNSLYLGLVKRSWWRNGMLGWVYWPNGYADYRMTGLKLPFIFDADHNIIDDPNLEASGKNDLAMLLREIAANAAMIVCASPSMLNWFQENGAKQVFRLRNGIDLARFSEQKDAKTGKFTIVYCGILSNWVNYDLFVKLIEQNPDVDFVIIGKAYLNDSYNKLRLYPNVILMGEKSADEVAALLPEYHAGLALYKHDKLVDGDSMKIYEYLAAGLPVICTDYHPLLKEDFGNLLLVGDSFDELNKIIAGMKAGLVNTDHLAVQHFLSQSTWARRVDEVLNSTKIKAVI